MRRAFALALLLAVTPAVPQVVNRTGDNAVKIPIVAGKRVTSTIPPIGGGFGVLSTAETFDTLMGICSPNCGVPYDPPYNAHWVSIGDPGCVRTVQNAVAISTGAFFSDLTPTDTQARHCGMNDINPPANMPVGTT